jgi:hypothetical protein
VKKSGSAVRMSSAQRALAANSSGRYFIGFLPGRARRLATMVDGPATGQRRQER